MFIGVVILFIYLIKKQEHKEFLNQIKMNDEFKLSCAHQGNKNILTKLGEEKFIYFFGKQQFDQIKSGTDTKIVELLKERMILK